MRMGFGDGWSIRIIRAIRGNMPWCSAPFYLRDLCVLGVHSFSKNKTPRPAGSRGGERGAGAPAYFFVVKMYFATCDLWCEATLRWMTLLLTALSRAEL